MNTRTERQNSRDAYAREWEKIEELKRDVARLRAELARRFPKEYAR